ncbi:winged helix-turn-helix domain-containing protein [Streptomyces narbonensis]
MTRQRLRVSLSVATIRRPLKRHGGSWQTPARGAFALPRDAMTVSVGPFG